MEGPFSVMIRPARRGTVSTRPSGGRWSGSSPGAPWKGSRPTIRSFVPFSWFFFVSYSFFTPVIYSPNGIGSAWARDSYGRWLNPVEPGGERQRRLAIQLGVNIIMYTLCSDYKQDRIHLPFLRQKI